MRKSLFLIALTGLLATSASAQTPPGAQAQGPGVSATTGGKAWPKFILTQPPGSSVGNVSDTNAGGVRALVVNFNTEAQPKDVIAEFDKQLKAAGFNVVTSGGPDNQTVSATKGKESVAITAKAAAKGTEFSVSYNAMP